MHSPAKKSIFKLFDRQNLIFTEKNFNAPGMMPDQFGIRFKIFPIVELTLLGEQNFKLGLYSEKFWKALKMKGHLESLLSEIVVG